MKRPHKPYVPVRGDARTTWSAEVPEGPPDGTTPDLDGARPLTSGIQGARARPGVKAPQAAPPLPAGSPPLPAPPADGHAIDLDTATVRADELLAALALGDDETVGHLQRTAATVEAVARSLGWDETRVRWTTFGALLHDIGKIGVAPQVMRKPGPLSDSEQAAMRDHVVYGTHLVSAYGFPPLVARIVREHHERLDGSGYPMGLQSEDICEEARLVMLADIADAMLSRRAYKQALTLDDVRRALEAGAGDLFDADLVEPVVAELVKAEQAI